ncbi:DUF2835 family protein [Alteromonas aestuariivivens]|uniref:DUF2835 family protein n=1 Tax=Alteromonas aestuariivivens TaxID=1938339 RepID=A0A3D8M7X8_9ALTE|nr:DUF2835 family protein [Alteromonas aestuariivivens]RDV25971.1 DUF2835 family protein [Alteromonas aestuariivivens]
MNTKPEQIYYFTLSLNYQQCESLYFPGNHKVVLTAENGTRVQIPSSRLRSHVHSYGLSGRFRLIVGNDNKIRTFEKIR